MFHCLRGREKRCARARVRIVENVLSLKFELRLNAMHQNGARKLARNVLETNLKGSIRVKTAGT